MPPERIVRRDDGGPWIVGHGGSVAGYTAYLCFDPETSKIARKTARLPVDTALSRFPKTLALSRRPD